MSVTAAHAVFDQAVDEFWPEGVWALFSGGHDSLTSTALAAKHPSFRGVIHINTGIGIEETREFVRDTCSTQGWDLAELRAPEGEYEQHVLRSGFPFGPQSHNAMLYKLKQKPLAEWMRGQTGRVGLVSGIRKQESVRRMGANISVPVRRDGRKVWISPILEWSKLECGRFLVAEGLMWGLGPLGRDS
jgi:3'-phosphoadenosine 5'-phosphosulfate sulfotransferase (PAPS reductase)/FAD synthetase